MGRPRTLLIPTQVRRREGDTNATVATKVDAAPANRCNEDEEDNNNNDGT